MLISNQRIKQFCGLLACVIASPLILSSAVAGVPASSMKMPRVSTSLLLDIEQVGNKIVAVGERGHIILSSDEGSTWVQAEVATAQMLNAVKFADEKQGWAVGHDGNIVHTSDGGETWTLQRNGLKAQKVLNLTAISDAKAKIAELENAIAAAVNVEAPAAVEPVAAVDGEEPALSLEEQLEEAQYQLESAEEKQKDTVIAAPLMDVWFRDANNGWVVGAFGMLLQTVDGGKTWIDRSKTIDNADGYHLNAIVGSGDTIYIAGEAGLMTYSNDAGQTWVKADIGYEGTIFGMFMPTDASYVVVTGLRGNTFRSDDRGLTWTQLQPNVNYSLSSGNIVDTDYIVLVGAGGSISVSEDKGANFKRYTLPARASLSSVIVLEKGRFLVVGQGGVYTYSINTVEK